MMDLQRINVKFFVADDKGVAPTEFVRLFNAWIQASDGEYYDIADYSHVQAGPGVILIAHEANVGMDRTGGRLGLLYNRKRPLSGGNVEKLELVFKKTLEYCRLIENEPALEGKIRFEGSEALLLVNDRLLAPNDDDTLESVRPDLEELAKRLFAGAEFRFRRHQRPRDRFAVEVKSSAASGVSDLLRNLENRKGPDGGESWATTRSLWS